MTQLEIYNLALASIGADVLASVSEDSKGAEICNTFWALTRNIVLSAYPFPSCTKRTKLIALSGLEKYEYAYAYSLPSDYLSLIEIISLKGTAPYGGSRFILEGNSIMIDIEKPIIRYIFDNTDTTTYEVPLIELLVLHLSYQISYALQGKESRTDMQMQKYMAKLNEVTTAFSRTRTNEPQGDDYMIGERM